MNNIAKLLVQQLMSEQIKSGCTLKQIELATKSYLEQLGRKIVELIANEQEQNCSNSISCQCGEDADYVRRRTVGSKTIYGEIELTRRYYLCPSCHTGVAPVDKQLQIKPNSVSPALAEYIAFIGTQLPYQASKTVIETFLPIAISDQTIAKAVYRWGKQIEAVEKEGYEASCQAENLLQQKREGSAPRRLYGTMDAVKVHTKEQGVYGWRDVKIGAWFEARATPPKSPQGDWSIQAENITYYADICEAETFGKQLWCTGFKQNANIATELIIIGDGAEWIWNLTTHYYPESIQILDWFHASEHLKPVSLTIEDEAKQIKWIETMKGELWEGNVTIVIEECRKLFAMNQQEICRLTANYFDNQKQRMQYDKYRAEGYQIGSGTIESAAKQIGLMRMKVPGATWNIENAPMMAKARASLLSGNRPQFSI